MRKGPYRYTEATIDANAPDNPGVYLLSASTSGDIYVAPVSKGLSPDTSMHYGRFLAAKIFRIRAGTRGIPKHSGLRYWMRNEISRKYHEISPCIVSLASFNYKIW